MRCSSALGRAPPTSPPPPIPITSGRRAARRIASASATEPVPYHDRGVQLSLGVDDPASIAGTDTPLGPGVGGGAVSELGVEPLGIRPGEQLFFERPPVGGVVDVVGDVALDQPEGR